MGQSKIRDTIKTIYSLSGAVKNMGYNKKNDLFVKWGGQKYGIQ